MNLVELIKPETVFLDVAARSKKQVLEELSKRAATETGLETRFLFDILVDRERLGPTGIGKGIAIPHAKITELKKIHSLFIRLEEPIDYEAPEEEPVDLLFVILAPENSESKYLKLLAQISRLLRDDHVCTKIRQANRSEKLCSVLTNTTTHRAA
ncbi:MAG: PTS IIA-like nitrogen-regulatory protein PtsN [Rhodospirillaceae bacterium]|nr:PTS IIA-like nitrogen-regulatory protein PtsN [Rhodospirillaceae bacterium]|tara:strand:- start:1629 stop:2093 length:465 start_codon:yes stop_codon:yes gene_type:complete